MREQVTGEWSKLHSDKLDGLYYSPVLFRWLKQGELARQKLEGEVGRREKCIHGFGGETGQIGLHGRLAQGYEHKNGINFEEVGWGVGL